MPLEMDTNLCPFALQALGFRLSEKVFGNVSWSDRAGILQSLRLIEQPRARRQDDDPSLSQTSDRPRGLARQ